MTVILRRTQPHSAGTMSSMTIIMQKPLRMPDGIENVEKSPEQFLHGCTADCEVPSSERESGNLVGLLY